MDLSFVFLSFFLFTIDAHSTTAHLYTSTYFATSLLARHGWFVCSRMLKNASFVPALSASLLSLSLTPSYLDSFPRL